MTIRESGGASWGRECWTTESPRRPERRSAVHIKLDQRTESVDRQREQPDRRKGATGNMRSCASWGDRIGTVGPLVLSIAPPHLIVMCAPKPRSKRVTGGICVRKNPQGVGLLAHLHTHPLYYPPNVMISKDGLYSGDHACERSDCAREESKTGTGEPCGLLGGWRK